MVDVLVFMGYNADMATNPKKTEEILQNLQVNTNSVIGSKYAQIVGVNVTNIDITLEFVYQHPNQQIEQANVVSRVTLPRQAGEGLAKTIPDTIKLHEDRKKEEKNG